MTQRIVGLAMLLLIWSAPSEGAKKEKEPKKREPRVIIALTPRIGIANMTVFTLSGALDDPDALYQCPAYTWTWPDGTESSGQFDCEPDAKETRHGTHVIRRFRLGEGFYEFKLTFKHGKKQWSDTVTLEVK